MVDAPLIRPILYISLLGVTAVSMSACSTMTPATPAVAPVLEAPRVALVLGGGGAKGFAHVGVIKALEKGGITPTIVVGTSVGSLVGSLYASGIQPSRLEQIALTTADSELLDFTLSSQGFIEGIKLKNFINTHVMGQSIEDFPITFAAIAAERSTLTKTVFSTGNAGLAVQASCSLPNVFISPRIPEKIGKKYIDGGVVSLIPVDSAFDLGADIVIAVDVTATNSTATKKSSQMLNINSLGSFWGLLEQNLTTNVSTATSKHTNAELSRADIVITPKISHISSLDTSQRRDLIEAGSQATTAQIITIKQLIADKSKSKYARL